MNAEAFDSLISGSLLEIETGEMFVERFETNLEGAYPLLLPESQFENEVLEKEDPQLADERLLWCNEDIACSSEGQKFLRHGPTPYA